MRFPTVYTDAAGLEHTRPRREYTDDISWLRADCAYNNQIAAVASRAFDRGFRRALRSK